MNGKKNLLSTSIVLFLVILINVGCAIPQGDLVSVSIEYDKTQVPQFKAMLDQEHFNFGAGSAMMAHKKLPDDGQSTMILTLKFPKGSFGSGDEFQFEIPKKNKNQGIINLVVSKRSEGPCVWQKRTSGTCWEPKAATRAAN